MINGMNKVEYFNKIKNQISLLNKIGFNHVVGDYVCPTCLQKFENVDDLTEEDVPQSALKGKRITLTCAKCNNTFGHTIDYSLINLIKTKDNKKKLFGTNRQIFINIDSKKLNAELKIKEDRSFYININKKRNNPQVMDFFTNDVLLKDNIIDVYDKLEKYDIETVSAAIIKNAYLLLFEKVGFSILGESFYDSIRKQLKEPYVCYLPERLWTIQEIGGDDGIYLSQDFRYRGFFIIYTVEHISKYKVCVFIPTINVEYYHAAKLLQEIKAGDQISVVPFPNNMDFFEDEKAIIKLQKWCEGKVINI